MSNSVIDKIRQELDITQIVGQELNLVKKGNNYVALCPFHDDSRPSLIVSSPKQIFKCFSCGKGGDVISFYSAYHKVTFSRGAWKVSGRGWIDYKPFAR
ncbi:CHC2 zinc finger domain-containing protein [Mycoplasma sp. ATU-Cv-508]|uniref:CHC2 zinc finger domain-containing protein n=1 Tax=Mycoplasma sp. ATU-Cv-508 TaxID=2048001 RepID=UPI000FDDBFEE